MHDVEGQEADGLTVREGAHNEGDDRGDRDYREDAQTAAAGSTRVLRRPGLLRRSVGDEVGVARWRLRGSRRLISERTGGRFDRWSFVAHALSTLLGYFRLLAAGAAVT